MTDQELAAQLAQVRRSMASGRMQEAKTLNAAILLARPRNPGALIQRSRIESNLGNYRLARAYTLQAHAVGVDSIRDSTNLLKRLRNFGLLREMREAIRSLSDASLRDEELLNLAAVMLNSINEPEQALVYIQQGLQLYPESIQLQLSKGQTLMFLGRFTEAETFLLQCLAKRPGMAFGWWLLSRLKKQSHGSNNVAKLRREQAEATHPQDIAFFSYALHKELDDLGDVEGASDALTRANNTMHAALRYSSAEDEELFSKLRSLPDLEMPLPGSHSKVPLTPIFIVGMHRSGTSLMEQFLDGHPDVFCAGELYDFTVQLRYAANHHCSGEIDAKIVDSVDRMDFDEIGNGYIDAVRWRVGGHTHITDKLPSNFLNIGLILRALPYAKIVHMVRDPMETCFSNLREYFSESTARYSYDQLELATYFTRYQELMRHWRRQFPGRILDVAYKDLVQDSEASLKRISAFCGLDYVPAMLDTASRSRGVVTASVVQVRSKAALPAVPKWEPYRSYLRPLIEELSQQQTT